MPFAELVQAFKYSDAAADRGVDPEGDHLWANLERAAREETDSDRAEAIHDISWVLTQIDSAQKTKLVKIRDGIELALHDAFGPRVLELAASSNMPLEGFVVPLAKVKDDDERPHSLEEFLQRLALRKAGLPTPQFAGVFAKCWLQKFAINSLQECPLAASQRGQRSFVGSAGNCKDCDNGLRKREIDRWGNGIVCQQCGRWIELPHAAQDGWVWPVTDAQGNTRGWVRLRFEDRNG